MDSRRLAAFGLLAAANLMWSGNWVLGRALREAFDPLSLNFWRWSVALLAMAPFALAQVRGHGALVRRHAGLLCMLALFGAFLFQSLVYLGLESTTAINGVLINAAGPFFIMLWSWGLEREPASLRQVAGMLLSFLGIVIIVCRGEPARLLQLEIHRGDAWILLAMPMWGLYSVLLKRAPAELHGLALTFVIACIGVAMMLPFFVLDAARGAMRWPGAAGIAGIVYVGLAASFGAFLCWNRGVAVLGANVAGFTLPLLPAFGTLLAMAFLGEPFQAFHAAAFATILAGVILATFRSGSREAGTRRPAG
ncbi:MAG TPA: DMT family transporter [Burkholderiales bacterium]|nr:DMT family transporter [Burkholderiales bacterium]